MTRPLLRIDALTVRSVQPSRSMLLLHNVCLAIGAGETVGLIGESGSGKSTLALALLGLLPTSMHAVHGQLHWHTTAISMRDEADLARLRRNGIATIFQDPSTSLNPFLTIGQQLDEVPRQRPTDRRQRRQQSVAMLERVGIPDARRCVGQFAHTLSGGLKQRVAIAMALLADPVLLVADEPTTALDVTVQAGILTLLAQLCRERAMAMLLITHDLAVASNLCQRIAVLQRGRLVECLTTERWLKAARHPYSQFLLAQARPKRATVAKSSDSARPTTPPTPVAKLCEVGVAISTAGFFPWQPKQRRTLVWPTNLALFSGEILALIGESGSGKTTLGRTLAHLIAPTAGHIVFANPPHGRRRVQMVFQEAKLSFDPRRTIGQAIAESSALTRARAGHDATGGETVATLLASVGLAATLADRKPNALSGGQLQRAALARALAAEPSILVADEPTSALDAATKQQILALLERLARGRNMAILLITHDLTNLQVATRIAVMCDGRIVEQADTSAFFAGPGHPYSEALLAAVPTLPA